MGPGRQQAGGQDLSPVAQRVGTKVSSDELFTGTVLSAELIPFLPAGGLTKLSLQVMRENAAEFI